MAKSELDHFPLIKDWSCYGIDYDYDTERNCYENNCDSICRCSTMENFQIKSGPNPIEAFDFNPKSLLDYAKSRILYHSGFSDRDNYYADIGRGYYGQELYGIHLEPSVAEEINKQWAELTESDNCIEKCLEFEYGYLLDSVKGKKWSIEKIDRSLIITGNQDYMKRVDKKLVDKYKQSDYNLAVCVVVAVEDKFRLIDGYHRLSATEDKKILAVVGR